MFDSSIIYYTKRGQFKAQHLLEVPMNELHREDGPAVDAPGAKYWYVNGRPHRVAGPAIEFLIGDGEWWINGRLLNTKKVRAWIEENNVNLNTNEGQVAFIIRWS